MSYYSALPYFVSMAVLVLLASTPWFRAADTAPIPVKQRLSTLDGLRGFLALSVFFHHGSIYHDFIRTGVWGAPPSQFLNIVGQEGVALFFMITGFLFWANIIRSEGRPNLLQLYVGRIFRIGPLYVLAVSLMIVFVFARAQMHLNVAPLRLVIELCKWLLLGVTIGDSMNGFAQAGVFLAYVTWSLHYEWLFYFSLAFTRYLARRRTLQLLAPVVGLVSSIAVMVFMEAHGRDPRTVAFVALFCAGMAVAALRARFPGAETSHPVFSWIVIALLTTATAFSRTAYGPLAILLLTPAFYLLAHGTSLFGLLTSRGARRLGDVSFGIYLLQGPVLAAVFSTTAIRTLSLRSPAHHWAVVLVGGVALVVVSTVAHVLVERRGVDLGRHVLKLIDDRVRDLSPPSPGREGVALRACAPAASR